MTVEQMKEVIEFLPALFINIVPGYLTLWVFSFFSSRDLNKDNHLVFKSLIISFLLNNFIDIIYASNGYIRDFIIPVILAILTGFILSIVSKSTLWNKILVKISNKTTHKNIWADNIDFKQGDWVRVYIPSGNIHYLGMLREYELTNKDNYFLALSNYTSVNTSTGKILEDYKESSCNMVVVNIKDINRIELVRETKENNSKYEKNEEYKEGKSGTCKTSESFIMEKQIIDTSLQSKEVIK